METPYSTISEIREATTPEEANDLLKQGFTLVKAVQKNSVDSGGRQISDIIYVLGRPTTNGDSQAASSERDESSEDQTVGQIVDSGVLDKLPWRKFENGGGEWTFLTTPNDALVPDLVPAREFVERLKAGEEIAVGNYRYRVREKFLKRFPTDGATE